MGGKWVYQDFEDCAGQLQDWEQCCENLGVEFGGVCFCGDVGGCCDGDDLIL